MAPEHPAAVGPASGTSLADDLDGPERRVIEAFLAGRPPAPAWVDVDAGHDCAVVDGGIALKVDTVVGGVHFDGRWSAAEVGWKAVAAVVSDLGAAGARPTWLMVSVSSREPGWAEGVAQGVGEACRAFGAYLVGGDVTGVPSGAAPVVSVSGGGRCVAQPRTRSGARPGDDVWVTGTLGLAGLGWFDPAAPAEALRALRRPLPPLAFALDLADGALASAAMDVSDGLASDVPRLARASKVRVTIDPDAVPVAPTVASHPDGRRLALGGGDDHELLFAALPVDADRVRAAAARSGVRVTRIGGVHDGAGCALVGAPWPAPLFSHFGVSA